MSSKTIQTVSEGYKIEHLTIAVVVNRKRVLAALGEGATPEAWTSSSRRSSGWSGRPPAWTQARRPNHRCRRRVPAKRPKALEPVPGSAPLAQLMDHTGSLIKAIAMIAITMLLIWFGLRPATRALLDVRPGEAVRVPGAAGAAPRRQQAAAAGGSPGNSRPTLLPI